MSIFYQSADWTYRIASKCIDTFNQIQFKKILQGNVVLVSSGKTDFGSKEVRQEPGRSSQQILMQSSATSEYETPAKNLN